MGQKSNVTFVIPNKHETKQLLFAGTRDYVFIYLFIYLKEQLVHV